MLKLLKAKIDLSFIVNPFYLYCTSFLVAISVYLFGWSRLFPKISFGLILFLLLTFLIFILLGIALNKKRAGLIHTVPSDTRLNEILFGLILFLGLLNILYMGYLPILDRSHNYREFGMPVIDPVFNTLSIFFSVFFFHHFLISKKKKFLIWVLLILFIQIIIFRRSTIMWILVSSAFLYILTKKKLGIPLIAASIILIPVISFLFGLYGNTRSNLKKSFVLNELGASDGFKNSKISYNHYMTYLYISSPLANLQENIDNRAGNHDNNFKDFLFYCIVPESITMRVENSLNLSPPVCYLITSELLAGTLYMVSYYTFGLTGMVFMYLYLTGFIILCLYIISKWNAFGLETFSILSSMVCLSVFSNFMNRLDVILMLLIYPVLFHLLFLAAHKRETLKLNS